MFLITLIVTKGDAAVWLAMDNYFDGAYTDYFRQICYVSDLKNFYFTTNDAPKCFTFNITGIGTVRKLRFVCYLF